MSADPEKLTPTKINGYKPVTHRGCGGQLAWVMEHVKNFDRLRASPVLRMDGSQVLANTPFDFVCTRCERQIKSPMECAI